MWVKICGITRLQDAVAAARFGADALGFVFVESPRRVTPEQVRAITRELPSRPVKVGVFADMPSEEVARIADFCDLDMVQLHGSEDAGYCEAIGSNVIKALRVRENTDLLRAHAYRCCAVLLDGYNGEASGKSAAGAKRVDWRMLRVMEQGPPLIIAGGLHPGNVGDAVRETIPYGVDVSRGVESAPGIKDPVLIYRFIESARRADYEVNDN
jgi:phosphoribosylanthranilate isomerase